MHLKTSEKLLNVKIPIIIANIFVEFVYFGAHTHSYRVVQPSWDAQNVKYNNYSQKNKKKFNQTYITSINDLFYTYFLTYG